MFGLNGRHYYLYQQAEAALIIFNIFLDYCLTTLENKTKQKKIRMEKLSKLAFEAQSDVVRMHVTDKTDSRYGQEANDV